MSAVNDIPSYFPTTFEGDGKFHLGNSTLLFPLFCELEITISSLTPVLPTLHCVIALLSPTRSLLFPFVNRRLSLLAIPIILVQCRTLVARAMAFRMAAYARFSFSSLLPVSYPRCFSFGLLRTSQCWPTSRFAPSFSLSRCILFIDLKMRCIPKLPR